MKQIEIKETAAADKQLSLVCPHCAGVMRLIGSEPHPVQDNSDLLTYLCTACDEFLVLPLASPAQLRLRAN